MNWYKLSQIDIIPFDYENNDNYDIDYEREDYQSGAEKTFSESGIRVSRDKNMTQLAIENGKVIGAIASSWNKEDEYDGKDVYVFSFDIAVKPEFRGPKMVGLKLIAAAIKQYEHEKTIYEETDGLTMMRLWVVNRRLIPVLEQKFGFDLESDLGKSGAYLIRY